jgi:catalase (peroxidase I)
MSEDWRIGRIERALIGELNRLGNLSDDRTKGVMTRAAASCERDGIFTALRIVQKWRDAEDRPETYAQEANK